MSCHPRVTEWTLIIQTHVPRVRTPPATVLALFGLGEYAVCWLDVSPPVPLFFHACHDWAVRQEGGDV